MLDFCRDGSPRDEPTPVQQLPTQQRRVLEVIDAIEQATGEACSMRLLARRCRVHLSTMQGHVSALHRKGWLKSGGSPISLRRRP